MCLVCQLLSYLYLYSHIQNQHKQAKLFALTVSERFSPSQRGGKTVTCTVAPRLLHPDLHPGASGHRWTAHATAVCELAQSRWKPVLSLKLSPSLYTCWEPSSSSNKSGSPNCHCLAGEPPYLIPTPTILYICTFGPVIIHTGEEKGRQGGEICTTSQIQIQIYFSFFLLPGRRASSGKNFSPGLSPSLLARTWLKIQSSKMAQEVKVLAAKPDVLSSRWKHFSQKNGHTIVPSNIIHNRYKIETIQTASS